MPATDTPGAKAARVNEFIDFILTEWATERRAHSTFSPVSPMSTSKATNFSAKNFLECLASYSRPLCSAPWTMPSTGSTSRDRMRDGNTVPREPRHPASTANFFRVFKGITLHGYYTSEIGFTQELKLEIIPGRSMVAYHMSGREEG